MICYKDMTFCTFYKDCQDGKVCSRSLTPKVRESADKWFIPEGYEHAPICQFSNPPDCMKPKTKKRTKKPPIREKS